MESGLAVADYSTCLTGWAFPFPGVFLAEKFVNEEEEAEMVNLMDDNEWKPSQSGRRKQVRFSFRKERAIYRSLVGTTLTIPVLQYISS